MNGLGIKIRGWEDGQYQEHVLDETDRWSIHRADEVELTMGGAMIVIKQRTDWTIHVLSGFYVRTNKSACFPFAPPFSQPKAINATRMGVGACLWEGELLLAAYLASLPLYRFIGARVIELGAGPGLVGLLLAKLGAKVVITDIPKVLPLIQENIDANQIGLQHRREGCAGGYAEAEALEWGAPGYEEVAARLALEPVDWVLAADCCYIDQEGTSPSTQHFVRTCAALCGPRSSTRCLVSFELRSSEVKRVFLEEAGKAFTQVTRIPPASLPRGCQVEHIELYELRHVAA